MAQLTRWFGRGNTRALVISAGVLALLVTPLALAQSDGATGRAAAGEGDPIEGGTRNPSNDRSEELERETEIIASTSTYGTRQSNKSTNGGGAIYGCRSGAGGSPADNEPCIRATNLNNGLAFEFDSDGAVVGTITARSSSAKPFTTNATGVADGLNADRVDGANAGDIVAAARQKQGLAAASADTATNAQNLGGEPPATYATRWALVDTATGAVVQQTGGFTVEQTQAGNVYLSAGEDVTDNGLWGQNVAVSDVADTGEVDVGACGRAAVTCTAPGTEDEEIILLNPEGTVTRAYVFVTGSTAASG